MQIAIRLYWTELYFPLSDFAVPGNIYPTEHDRRSSDGTFRRWSATLTAGPFQGGGWQA